MNKDHDKKRIEPERDNDALKEALPITLKDSDLEKIKKVQEYIVNHPEKTDFSIPGLASDFRIGEFKLKYGFKKLYRTTIFRYLQDQRLNRAKSLVQYSTLSIKKIAKKTGFKTSPHFSRKFKEKYGCSPREFRKQFWGKKGK